MTSALFIIAMACGQTPDVFGEVGAHVQIAAACQRILIDEADHRPASRGDRRVSELITWLKSAHQDFPADSLITRGLALARAEVTYESDAAAGLLQPERIWYPNWLYASVVVVFGYLAWCLICAVFPFWLRRRSRTLLLVMLALAPPALVPPLNQFVQSVRSNCNGVTPQVVIGEDLDIVGKISPLFAGNGRDYPIKAIVPVGAECRQIGKRGRWVQVEFASGLTGWIETKEERTAGLL